MSRIPVVLLSGFLGSGKTTLLLKMLSQSKEMGLNYAVLINERGKLDIDGLLVSKQFDHEKIESLLDGCICCSKKSEIARSMEVLLQKKPDAIFIELTGVANPEEVAKMLNEREVIAKVELKNIMTIIDAEFFLDTKSNDFQDTIFHQLECANHIVVNKIDLVEKSVCEEINEAINKRNPSAKVEFAMYGEIDFEKLLQQVMTTENKKESRINKNIKQRPTSYASMTTLVLPVAHSLKKTIIESFFTKYADKIVRAKGFVPILEDRGTTSYLMQYSGVKRIDWQLESSEQYYLILIGIDLDTSALKSEWLKLFELQTELVKINEDGGNKWERKFGSNI
ncbi:GTP-binding protein [Bacillus sp. OK048]|uniref:CobW family GTP-binding protein n=1 Tax=Bacillus sp. OK048 TaxID=1882761 RepID=UPI0008900C37|nr:CobW family GTP-binding protein [Bacillus sp. OK048]SDM40948.1 GTPase, G3E family [Bacillus sp. OK048]